MDPFSIMMMVSAGVGVLGSLYGGQQQAQLAHLQADEIQRAADANYFAAIRNSQILKRNAVDYSANIRRQADLDATNIRSQGRAQVGEMAADFGASGASIGSGSPRNVLLAQMNRFEVNANLALDAGDQTSRNTIRGALDDIDMMLYNARNQRTAAYNNASIVRAGGEAAKTASFFDALGTGISGASYFYKPSAPSSTGYNSSTPSFSSSGGMGRGGRNDYLYSVNPNAWQYK